MMVIMGSPDKVIYTSYLTSKICRPTHTSPMRNFERSIASNDTKSFELNRTAHFGAVHTFRKREGPKVNFEGGSDDFHNLRVIPNPQMTRTPNMRYPEPNLSEFRTCRGPDIRLSVDVAE